MSEDKIYPTPNDNVTPFPSTSKTEESEWKLLENLVADLAEKVHQRQIKGIAFSIAFGDGTVGQNCIVLPNCNRFELLAGVTLLHAAMVNRLLEEIK